MSPGCLPTEAARLGAKASTGSASKINRSISTTQSRPLSFHLLRCSSGGAADVNVSVCFNTGSADCGQILSQGAINSTQPSIPPRWGSDFRLEQRRLLSSFNCDSDLLKFNQLKVEYMKLNALKNVYKKMLFIRQAGTTCSV